MQLGLQEISFLENFIMSISHTGNSSEMVSISSIILSFNFSKMVFCCGAVSVARALAVDLVTAMLDSMFGVVWLLKMRSSKGRFYNIFSKYSKSFRNKFLEA